MPYGSIVKQLINNPNVQICEHKTTNIILPAEKIGMFAIVKRSEDINTQWSLNQSYFPDYKINIYYNICKGKNIK